MKAPECEIFKKNSQAPENMSETPEESTLLFKLPWVEKNEKVTIFHMSWYVIEYCFELEIIAVELISLSSFIVIVLEVPSDQALF